jgi:hypothetical protein
MFGSTTNTPRYEDVKLGDCIAISVSDTCVGMSADSPNKVAGTCAFTASSGMARQLNGWSFATHWKIWAMEFTPHPMRVMPSRCSKSY